MAPFTKAFLRATFLALAEQQDLAESADRLHSDLATVAAQVVVLAAAEHALVSAVAEQALVFAVAAHALVSAVSAHALVFRVAEQALVLAVAEQALALTAVVELVLLAQQSSPAWSEVMVAKAANVNKTRVLFIRLSVCTKLLVFFRKPHSTLPNHVKGKIRWDLAGGVEPAHEQTIRTRVRCHGLRAAAVGSQPGSTVQRFNGSRFKVVALTRPPPPAFGSERFLLQSRHEPVRALIGLQLCLMPSKRILVVDDETPVRETVRMILEHDGHTVVTAANGPEALGKYDSDRFDLVLTDFKMPGMRGDKLAQEIKRRNPRQRVALLTGFPPAVLPACFDRMLLKPCSVAEIRNLIATLT